MNQPKNLYLFDFDGTLTNKDSLFDFLKQSFPNYWLGFLVNLPNFILAKLKIIPNWKAKERFISYFLKGKSKKEIEILAQKYFEENKVRILKSSAITYIQNLPKNSEVYIVSASLDIWLKPFADFLEARLICTVGQFNQNHYTGIFATPNCNYEEKRQRIVQEIPLESYDNIFVFGDTKGDAAMSSLGTKYFHQFFS